MHPMQPAQSTKELVADISKTVLGAHRPRICNVDPLRTLVEFSPRLNVWHIPMSFAALLINTVMESPAAADLSQSSFCTIGVLHVVRSRSTSRTDKFVPLARECRTKFSSSDCVASRVHSPPDFVSR